MNILLFGLPGSGKGTQGDNLVKEFNLYKVSTGELLREEIEKMLNDEALVKRDTEAGILGHFDKPGNGHSKRDKKYNTQKRREKEVDRKLKQFRKNI